MYLVINDLVLIEIFQKCEVFNINTLCFMKYMITELSIIFCLDVCSFLIECCVNNAWLIYIKITR